VTFSSPEEVSSGYKMACGALSLKLE